MSRPVSDGSITVIPPTAAEYVSLPPETVTSSAPSGLLRIYFSAPGAKFESPLDFFSNSEYAAKRARAPIPSSSRPVSLIIYITPLNAIIIHIII